MPTFLASAFCERPFSERSRRTVLANRADSVMTVSVSGPGPSAHRRLGYARRGGRPGEGASPIRPVGGPGMRRPPEAAAASSGTVARRGYFALRIVFFAVLFGAAFFAATFFVAVFFLGAITYLTAVARAAKASPGGTSGMLTLRNPWRNFARRSAARDGGHGRAPETRRARRGRLERVDMERAPMLEYERTLCVGTGERR